MFLATPWPAYLVGTACIGRGCFAILGPRSEYPRMGLALEASPPDAPQSPSGLVSPLMYFKGNREISYGLTILLLQRQGFDEALTTFLLVVGAVRLVDGAVIWWKGPKGLKYRSIGHFLWGTMMLYWGWQRGMLKEVLPLMHDLRAGGINPPFTY